MAGAAESFPVAASDARLAALRAGTTERISVITYLSAATDWAGTKRKWSRTSLFIF